MKSDALKLIFTYVTALVVIGGGLAMLYYTRLDPPEADVQGLRLLLSGFIGVALQFVFASDNSTRTARQIERIYNAAASSVPPPPSSPVIDYSAQNTGATLNSEVVRVPPAPTVAP